MKLPDSARLNYAFVDESYLEEMFKLDSDPEVMKFLKRATPTVDEARKKLDDYMNHKRSTSGLGAFAVRRKTNNEFLGFGFLVNIELNHINDVEVGYRLKKEVWGQGYATEIAEALLQYGFSELGLKEIYGTTDPNHVVSQHVLMKVGLVPMGDASFYKGCKIFKLSKK